MKILHVLDHSLPLHSGYAFRSMSILRTQKANGWDCFVVTSPKHEFHSGHQEQPEEEIEGFRHFRTGKTSHSSVPLIGELRLMRALEKRVFEVAVNRTPDIIHAHSPILNAFPALKVSRKLKLPVVYEVRALWEDAAVDHQTYSQKSWKYKAARRLETWICQSVDQVTVLCHGLRADLISRGVPAHKLTVVPNGVDAEEFESHKKMKSIGADWNLTGKRVIGFIGSFYRYEGIDLLLLAVARLREKRPNVVVLLVGGGEVEQELKGQIKKLRLEDAVVMPGRVSHESIADVYNLGEVFVYPRRSMRLTELVTPLKPLEAMAMGKPVIASDIGGHRELIENGHNGLLVPPESESQLAEMLNRVLDNTDLRQRLGRQAKSWVRRERSWQNLAPIYKRVYSAASGKSFK